MFVSALGGLGLAAAFLIGLVVIAARKKIGGKAKWKRMRAS